VNPPAEGLQGAQAQQCHVCEGTQIVLLEFSCPKYWLAQTNKGWPDLRAAQLWQGFEKSEL